MIEFEYIDHIAYVFKSIHAGYDFFKSHPGFKIHQGPGTNHVQNVNFLFISVKGIGKIEILSPLESSNKSPILEQINTSGPGFNHICYAVEDILDSIQKLREENWRVICNPVADIAFSGRRIAFLFHKDLGLIELVESRILLEENCSLLGKSELVHQDKNTYPHTNSIEYKNIDSSDTSTPSEIIELINNSIDGPNVQEISSFSEIDDWDSLSSAIFHASYELLVDKKLDPSLFQTLESYCIHYAECIHNHR